MAKKNFKKYIPKVGSTVAVAVAMTVALSTQVQATELDDADLLLDNNLLKDGAESELTLKIDGMEPAEANKVIEEENKETVEDNQEIIEDNEKTDQGNNADAEKNEELTEGELPNPDLELPKTPETPNTEGMGVEDHNEAVGEYNGEVDEYNAAVEEYNKEVDDYNADADKFEADEALRFEKEQTDYNKAEDLHEEAEEKLATDLENQDKDNTAYNEYEQAKDTYDQADSDYQEALDQYEESLQNGTADEESRTQYQQEKEAYDKAHADYLAALEKYNDTLSEHDPGSAEYQQYLQDKAAYDQACADYLAALEHYNTVVLPQYEEDSAEYQQYLQDKAAYDEAYAEYLDELYKYNNGELSDYGDRVEQSEKEKEILEDVNKYNQEVAEKNGLIEQANAAMKENIDVGVASDLEDVGALNDNVVVEEDIMEILRSFDALAQEQLILNEAGENLANHPGKGAELGSDAYAAYLKAVEEHNALVDVFNEKIAAYNAAVDIYNVAVEDYNQKKTDDSSSSTGIGTTSSDAEADWGNIKIDNVNIGHIDVKYNAAASMDVTVTTDANGNETTQYSETVTEYEVTGVYSSESAAATNPNRYGVSYQESASSTTVKTQTMNPYGGYEFHAGDVNGIRLDPATGKISFYATLESDGKKEDITVNLDANSVYAKGSYYKVSNGGHLGDYRFGEDLDQKLEIVTIDGERYYDISGHSVYVISSLTCDGMSESHGGGYWWSGSSSQSTTLTPWGLDLVLNLQTMIENHQAQSAKKIGYKAFELEKYKAADEQNLSDPGEAPQAPTFNPGELTPVNDPGKRPDAPTYDPGEFDREKPDEAIKVERLEHIDPLQKLNEKLIILFDDPTVPVLLNDDFVVDFEIEIPDEEVPLAAAPETGDISSLWGILSGFSAAGMFLLGRKRKEEE